LRRRGAGIGLVLLTDSSRDCVSLLFISRSSAFSRCSVSMSCFNCLFSVSRSTKGGSGCFFRIIFCNKYVRQSDNQKDHLRSCLTILQRAVIHLNLQFVSTTSLIAYSKQFMFVPTVKVKCKVLTVLGMGTYVRANTSSDVCMCVLTHGVILYRMSMVLTVGGHG